MKCKYIHNKIIGLIERTLPESEAIEMFNHIDSCKECKACYDYISATYNAIDTAVPEISPYFYSKLHQKIESKGRIQVPAISIVKRLQPIAAVLVLAIGISSGILIGKNLAASKIATIDTEHKTMLDTYASEYYLNDSNEESLNVLLTNE